MLVKFLKYLLILISLNCWAQKQLQTFPDSLKRTLVAQLKTNDTLTIYISRRNCFGGGMEKFQLTRQKANYILIAFKRITLHELQEKFGHLELEYLPDTLQFKILNTYVLTDTNIVSFARIEFLGLKCGIQPRNPGGAIGLYKIVFNKKNEEFSNMCNPIKGLEDLAIPEEYYADLDEQEK